MDEQAVRAFWQDHPCGDVQVSRRDFTEFEQFFQAYDTFRYRQEGHILGCLDNIDFAGKEVLEIGLGQGAESEQIVRRGGRWSGLDLTDEAVTRVRTRLELRALPYEHLVRGSAVDIPFPNEYFDIVFSHGVLHHIPDVGRAQAEIHRVLKPSGELIAMVYARNSLNYRVSISILRRLGLLAMVALRRERNGIVGEHVKNARQVGLWRYLRMDTFLHHNTDGPHNPYSKVYDLLTVRRDFPLFTVTKAYKRFMHAPPLPVSWLPFQRQLGWHLWLHMQPRKTQPST
jgi:SAM-dependent methyltransferase